MENNKIRSFKVSLNNCKPYGRYTGLAPYQAANKALSEIIRKKEKNNQKDSYRLFLFKNQFWNFIFTRGKC